VVSSVQVSPGKILRRVARYEIENGLIPDLVVEGFDPFTDTCLAIVAEKQPEQTRTKK